MKKYVKPELMYESFEMSQQIASCDYDGNFNETDCSFTGVNKDFGAEMNIFSSIPNPCSVIPDSYCYHNLSGDFGIFNS